MTRMSDVQHTNPHTGEAFVATFQRGIVAADGGEPGAGPPADVASATAASGRSAGASGHRRGPGAMVDVDHESGTAGATRSFERGVEGRADRV